MFFCFVFKPQNLNEKFSNTETAKFKFEQNGNLTNESIVIKCGKCEKVNLQVDSHQLSVKYFSIKQPVSKSTPRKNHQAGVISLTHGIVN